MIEHRTLISMDFVSSTMLSFEKVDDIFHFSSIPFQQHNFNFQHNFLLTPPASPLPPPPPPPPPFLDPCCDRNPITGNTEKGQRRSRPADLHDGDHDLDNDNDHKKRKLIHRNIERQRRQDMATLYRSLRSKLPHHWIKGKRSMSDNMNEAINYIKHLKEKVDEMKAKRDELVKSLDSNCPSSSNNGKPECGRSDVRVEACGKATMDVIISTPKTGGLPLSRVLNLLLQQGLTTVSCISTKETQKTLIHTIESEICDGKVIDATELQRKIMSLST